jgi:hypothetical protein
MSEETRQADKSAAWGVVLAVGCSAISGFVYVTALMFSIQVSGQQDWQQTVSNNFLCP